MSPTATAAPLTAATSSPAAGDALGPVSDLAKWNDGPAARYRIPALTQLDNGDLLAIYDARPQLDDLPNHLWVVMRRSTDGGKTWGPLQTLRKQAGRGFGDPSVVVDRQTGRIIVFYAASVNQGFFYSATGVDHDNPDVLQADISYSDDNGLTWASKRITNQVKDPSWGGIFASAGEGIQIRTGPHAGRLLQTYNLLKDGKVYAVNAYSDDHGETWQRGALTGPGTNENKVVELSDGTIMFNSRNAPYRTVAYSTDGGHSFSTPVPDRQQIDPSSNGTVIRVHPNAPVSNPRSKMLLLVNAEDRHLRRNHVAKLSCDNGKTWPGRTVIDDDAAAYITATPLGGGKVGLLYERDGYAIISYRSLDTSAMGAVCAPITAPTTADIEAGKSTPVPLTVTNQESNDLPSGTLTVTGPDDWQKSTAVVPPLAPGQSVTVTVPVTAPASASGARDLRATYITPQGASTANVEARVATGGTPVAGALRVEPVLEGIFPDLADDGFLGDRAIPWVRVTNIGNTPLADTHLVSSTGESDCLVASLLQPGQSVVCRARAVMGRTLTAADVAAGEWAPVYTATGTSALGQVSATKAMEPVDLLVEPLPWG